jgi:uncharacterized protein (DUF58 family)
MLRKPEPGVDEAQRTPEAVLQQLEWTVLRRLDGLLQGDHRTLWRGAGLDLADLREYQHGDDVRHIDWNITARLQVPHVRQYTEDRELTAWFLVDLSGSLDFGSADRSKRDLAEGFVAALARILTKHGNRVGALLYRPGAPQPVNVLPPGAGRLQVLQLLWQLRAPTAPAAASALAVKPARPSAAATAARRGAAATRQTDLAALLTRAEALIRRRSMVFVLSDFISTPGWSAPLGRLARRHEVLAVRLFDALELALPDIGLLTVEDAETGEQLQVDTQDAGFRQRFEALAAQHEARLRDQLAQAGVDTLELATGDDLLNALLRCVALRRQRARATLGHRLPAALRQPAAA